MILAEMGTQLARHAGVASRREELGGTPALWLALTQGDIDAYPEYTGTITRQILRTDPPDLAAALAAHGVRISGSLGFRNNYALGMRKDVAAAMGITKISDLRGHPELRLGFTNEFIDRPDGWPGLRRHYDLPQTNVQGMNHTLSYRGLVERAIDVTDMYTTDGEIAQYDLLALKDDQNFFPAYEAVWLYRADLAERHPAVVEQLRRLEGRISEAQMQRMNAAVQVGKQEEGTVAAEFLRSELGVDGPYIRTRPGTASAGDDRPAFAAGHPVAVGGGAGRRAAGGDRRPPPAVGPGGFRRHRHPADDPFARASAVHDSGDDVARGERDRGPAGDRRLVPLQPAADRAQHARRPDGDPRLPARVRRGARAAAAGDPLANRTAVGHADDPGRRADGGGDQRRHGDPRRLHRGRRLRRPDPPRNRQIRRAADARRGGSRGALGPGDRGPVRAGPAVGTAPRLTRKAQKSAS